MGKTIDTLNKNLQQTLDLSAYSQTNHTHNYAGSSSAGGAANSATKLATARTINGTSFDGTGNITTANWGTARNITIGNKTNSVNGSGNVSYTLADIGAAASGHGHSNMVQGSNDSRTTNQDGNANDLTASGFYRVSSTNSTSNPLPDSMHAHILHGQHPNSNYAYQIGIPYTNTTRMFFRVNDSNAWGDWHRVYHTGNKPTLSELGAAASSHGTHVTFGTTVPKAPGTAAVGSSTNVSRDDHVHPLQTSVSGNAGTATKLATARTLTIGNSGKTFDGSGNVSWSLSEIGAAASSHTHNYAGSSSAGGAANSAAKLATAKTISLSGLLSGSASFDGSANVSISAAVAKPPKSGDWFSGGIPTINTDGVMEIGKYIDFHNTDTSTNDYDVRLQANTSTPCVISLPSGSGTLARTNEVALIGDSAEDIAYTIESSLGDISNITSQIGTLSSLQTSAKGNLVAAINEVFQLGTSVKSRLVDALVANSVFGISTSSTIEQILNILESEDTTISYQPDKFTVEYVNGVDYGFYYDSGYYVNDDIGDGQYAMCKLTITNITGMTAYMDWLQSSESGYDYAVISNINSTLSTNNTADTDCLFNTKNGVSGTSQNLGNTSCYYYIKYRKDSSDSSGSDTFQFKIYFK